MNQVEKVLETHLDALKADGNYRQFLEIKKSAGQSPEFTYRAPDGSWKTATNWTSNDYLGMSVHPKTTSEMALTALESGSGSGGTRNISGTTHYHVALETELAELHTKEKALLFGSAYLANITALATLGKCIPDLVFLSDENNHASLIEGIRNSGNPKKIFRHNDVDHLEELLKSIPPGTPKMIVLESVYSISGSISPLEKVVELARKQNALIYLDEVHAVGLYGSFGGGKSEELGISSEITLINGTLAKAFGVIGGYIAGKDVFIDAIRSFGKGFIFTSSLPPAVCAAALASVRFVRKNPSFRKQLFQRVEELRTTLFNYDIPFLENESHITPIPVGNAFRAKEIARQLLEKHGVYLQPILPPTVPAGKECLRVVTTTKHTNAQVAHLTAALADVFCDCEKVTVESLKSEISPE